MVLLLVVVPDDLFLVVSWVSFLSLLVVALFFPSLQTPKSMRWIPLWTSTNHPPRPPPKKERVPRPRACTVALPASLSPRSFWALVHWLV